MAGYGTFPLNKIQLGRETTAGTAVAATTVWRGPATDISDESKHEFAEEDVGTLLPTEREYVPQLGAVLAMPETELTFEQFPHVLEAGVQTATPTGSGPYVRTYAFPAAATLNTIKTYTIETGNAGAGDVHEMEYAFVEQFDLSGASGEAWKISSNWIGRRKTLTSFTAALSLPTVEEALFAMTSLFVDNAGGTVGTTQKLGVLMGAKVSVKTGIVTVRSADGVLYFSKHKFTRPEVTWSYTLELESDSGVLAAERAAWVAKATRLVQFSIAGASSSAIKINLAGRYTSFGNYQNSDGNTVVEASGQARYNAAANLFAQFIVTNGVATL